MSRSVKLGAGLLLAGALAWGQTTLSLYFTVEEGDKLIGGLREENFRLFEDGQPVNFRLAEPESPALVTLLVEYSQGSLYYLTDIETALNAFVDAAPDGHWYSLATFSQELQIHVDFTRQKGEIRAAFGALGQPFWGEVNTFDALVEVLDKLEWLPGRKVVILIGSGLNTLSRHSLPEVQRKVEGAEVVIFGIGAGSLLRGQYEVYLSDSARMELTQAEAFLNMLARKTGGQSFFPRFQTAYRDIMRTVVLMLEQQYRIVYEPRFRRDGKFHRIRLEAFQEVEGKRRNFSVRVREGWRRQ